MRAVEGEHAIMRRPVLLGKATERVKPLAVAGDADMVRATRQFSQRLPLVGLRIVGVMIGAVDALFGVAADEMHSAAIFGSPSHFGAWESVAGLSISIGLACLRPMRDCR